jgi:8-oxo-dGTP pyrophosphatase MutT (NUDIX family)
VRDSLHEDLVVVLGRCPAELSTTAREWLAVASDIRSLDRTGEPAHFTASALPISADATKVCLVHHRKMGKWVQPGGHFEEGDATVAGAAAREMEEETGLSGRIDPVPIGLSRHPAPCRPDAWHLDVQLVVVAAEAIPLTSDESEDVAWFPVDRLPQPLAPGVEVLVARARVRVSRNGPRGSASPWE